MHGATDEEMVVIKDAVRSHAWIFHVMGELIGAAPTLTHYPRREHLVRAIEAAFHRLAVNPRVWTRRLGLARGTILLWRKGRTLPSLWCQLVVSSELGISPLQLLCGQLDSNTTFGGSSGSGDHHVDRPQTRHTPIDPMAVHHALEAVLASDEVPPPSLPRGCRSPGANLRKLPSLLSRTLPRHRRAVSDRPGGAGRTNSSEGAG